jgi:hypothetical protein
MLVMLRKKALDNGLQDSNILKKEPTANNNSLLFGVILVSL